MKKIIVIVLSVFCIQAYAGQITVEKPRVDKRVELLSIVFRLAGKPEYTSSRFALYTDRIDAYFKPYKDHELIRYTRSVIDSDKIAYDAVMSMAVNLDEKLDFLSATDGSSLDNRWKKEHAEHFVRLLKTFHKDTRFDTFVRDNSGLYEETSKRFLPVFEQLDQKWFESFYGKESQDRFVIIHSLANGGNNYGATVTHTDGSRTVYAILGTWLTDSGNMPVFPMDTYFPILVHEFNHSFVNPVTTKHLESLEKNAKRIFSLKEEQFTQQAYGDWTIMLSEALVRAAVIKYMKDHHFSNEDLNREIQQENDRGFIWIVDLVKELYQYDKERSRYPSLEAYMPRIAEAYQRFADYAEQSEKKAPVVVSISEFSNGDKAVNAGTGTITINYDKPLAGKGFSVFLGEKGKDAFPEVKDIYYTNDNKSVVMKVVLKKGKAYQFVMKGSRFKTADGFPAKDYQVDFTTRM